MTIAAQGAGVWLIIGLMALVTLLTRYGGVWIMSRLPIHRRIEGFINGMASAVLLALILPQAVQGDTAARLALLTTLLVMLWLRSPLPAIAAGLLMTAGWRFFF